MISNAQELYSSGFSRKKKAENPRNYWNNKDISTVNTKDKIYKTSLTLDMHEYFVWHRVESLLYNQPEEFIKKERISQWRKSVHVFEQLRNLTLND